MRKIKFQLLHRIVLLLFIFSGLLVQTTSFADRLPAAFVEKKFSVTFNDTDLKDALKLIARQGDVKIEFDDTLAGRVTYSFQDTTLESALKTLAVDQNLTYDFEDGVVYVEQESPVKTGAGGSPSAPGSSSGRSAGKVYKIDIKNASAREVGSKIPAFFKVNENMIVDDASNSIIFHGGDSSYKKLLSFVEVFDQMPAQILIDAQIVETSRNFSQELGFRWGDSSDSPTLSNGSRGTGFINTPKSKDPNLFGKVLLGWIDGRNLEATLAAAETNGTAKIVSRPKIITLNNHPATVHSGATFYVKTLSQKESTGSTAVAGGLTTVSSGLRLDVQPTIVGANSIRLQLQITNSEADFAQGVDGVPGIVDNSANAAIIVDDGNTVSLAGLIKSTKSKSETGAPLLSKIPVLGWLFKSREEKDKNTELMIFITPKIVRSPKDTKEEHAALLEKATKKD